MIQRNEPMKQNLYTPGTDIPIRSIKDSIKDIFNKNMVLLAWNFRQEVIKTMRKLGYKKRIILPIKKK